MGSLFESQRDGAAGSGRHRNDYWEPDVPTPDALLTTAIDTMQRAKTTYSDGRGEAGLRSALAEQYTRKVGRAIHADQILCFPGTQTSLFAIMMAVAEAGSEVLVATRCTPLTKV